MILLVAIVAGLFAAVLCLGVLVVGLIDNGDSAGKLLADHDERLRDHERRLSMAELRVTAGENRKRQPAVMHHELPPTHSMIRRRRQR